VITYLRMNMTHVLITIVIATVLAWIGLVGCSPGSVVSYSYTFDSTLEVHEDDAHVVITAAELHQIDSTRFLISQFLKGPLLLVNASTGIIESSLFPPSTLYDSVYRRFATDPSFNRYRLLTVDSAEALGMRIVVDGRMATYWKPQYVRIARRGAGVIDVLTIVKVAGVNGQTGQHTVVSVMGIVRMAGDGPNITSFTPLTIRDECYPQFAFFAPVSNKGWWVSTYDLSRTGGNAALPLLAYYDGAGFQDEHFIPIPPEADKQQIYPDLLNNMVMMNDDLAVLLDGRQGSVFLIDTRSRTAIRQFPFADGVEGIDMGDSTITFESVVRTSDNEFEIVVTTGYRTERPMQCYVVALRIDASTSGKRVSIVSVGTAPSGYLIGPGTVRTTVKSGGSRKDIVRMIYHDEHWYLATRKL